MLNIFKMFTRLFTVIFSEIKVFLEKNFFYFKVSMLEHVSNGNDASLKLKIV